MTVVRTLINLCTKLVTFVGQTGKQQRLGYVLEYRIAETCEREGMSQVTCGAECCCPWGRDHDRRAAGLPQTSLTSFTSLRGLIVCFWNVQRCVVITTSGLLYKWSLPFLLITYKRFTYPQIIITFFIWQLSSNFSKIIRKIIWFLTTYMDAIDAIQTRFFFVLGLILTTRTMFTTIFLLRLGKVKVLTR